MEDDVAGIHTSEDAKLAVEHKVDAIWVSNHGGRQVDGVLASIDILPEIIQAVQGKVEVYVDGGIRRGTSVFKALALGAKAVFIGRPVLWGLSTKVFYLVALGPSISPLHLFSIFSQGEEGVSKVLELLNNEFATTMVLAGGSLSFWPWFFGMLLKHFFFFSQAVAP